MPVRCLDAPRHHPDRIEDCKQTKGKGDTVAQHAVWQTISGLVQRDHHSGSWLQSRGQQAKKKDSNGGTCKKSSDARHVTPPLDLIGSGTSAEASAQSKPVKDQAPSKQGLR